MDKKSAATRREQIMLSHIIGNKTTKNEERSYHMENFLHHEVTKANYKSELRVKILGVGRYVPPHAIPSSTIDLVTNKPPGYTEKSSGIKERRYCYTVESIIKSQAQKMSWNVDKLDLKNAPLVDSSITQPKMAAHAVREAAMDAKIKLSDIDMIINASATPHYGIPDSSAYLQRELGLEKSGIPCLTLHTTCLSFVVALHTAANYIQSGTHDTIAIVSSELGSVCLNYKDSAHGAALIGDGAGAIILGKTPENENSRIMSTAFQTFADGADLTTVKGGGTLLHPNMPHVYNAKDFYFHMEGFKVLQFTASRAHDLLEKIKPNLAKGDTSGIDHIIPHQPSLQGLLLMTQTLKWPKEKIVTTLQKYGNVMSASIPLTLYEAIKEKKCVNRGDTILLAGTGAGLSIAGMLLTY